MVFFCFSHCSNVNAIGFKNALFQMTLHSSSFNNLQTLLFESKYTVTYSILLVAPCERELLSFLISYGNESNKAVYWSRIHLGQQG